MNFTVTYIFISEDAQLLHASHVIRKVVEDGRGKDKLRGFGFFKLLFQCREVYKMEIIKAPGLFECGERVHCDERPVSDPDRA